MGTSGTCWTISSTKDEGSLGGTCSLFPFSLRLGNQCGVGGNPSGSMKKGKGAPASLSIILNHRKSETLSPKPHFSSSCGLMNSLQQKTTEFCPVALVPAARTCQPSFLPALTFSLFPFLLPLLSLCLPGAMTNGFTGWLQPWSCGGHWPSPAG